VKLKPTAQPHSEDDANGGSDDERQGEKRGREGRALNLHFGEYEKERRGGRSLQIGINASGQARLTAY
jgi:hypothetical protein